MECFSKSNNRFRIELNDIDKGSSTAQHSFMLPAKVGSMQAIIAMLCAVSRRNVYCTILYCTGKVNALQLPFTSLFNTSPLENTVTHHHLNYWISGTDRIFSKFILINIIVDSELSWMTSINEEAQHSTIYDSIVQYTFLRLTAHNIAIIARIDSTFAGSMKLYSCVRSIHSRKIKNYHSSECVDWRIDFHG